jgi:hypothetical protein
MNVFRMTLATCMRSADWHKAQAFLVNKMCVQEQQLAAQVRTTRDTTTTIMVTTLTAPATAGSSTRQRSAPSSS